MIKTKPPKAMGPKALNKQRFRRHQTQQYTIYERLEPTDWDHFEQQIQCLLDSIRDPEYRERLAARIAEVDTPK